MNKTFTLTLMSIILLCCGCGSKQVADLSGAGATFPEPFYKMVFKKFSANTGSQVTYGAIGSGGGYRSLKDKTVDFGATDVFLSNEEMEAMGASVLHIPTTLGAVVLSYHLQGVQELKMTSQVVSDIFLGKITNWSDEAIQQLNPEVKLPNKAITVVVRSDGSGTTAVFSDYMSKVSPEWKEKIGKGKSLNFPVGVSAKGNAGVAGMIAETEGAIGYVGSEYALVLNIPTVSLQNSAGNFIKASAASISAAADTDIPADTRTTITDSANPNAYPISTFTWIIFYKEQAYNDRPESKALALRDLLTYVLSDEGQAMAQQIGYASLPATVISKAKAIIASMTFNGKPLATNNEVK